MNNEFSGKTVLVTGCKKGIGRSIAKRFAFGGANIVMNDLDIDYDSESVKEILAMGNQVLPVASDVRNSQAVSMMVDKAIAKFGKIDILVNNVGIYPAKDFLDIELDEWELVFDVNLKSMFIVTQEVVKKSMRHERGCKIINMTSSDGKSPTRGIAHYAASKAGVISLTKSLAIELSEYGITCNSVAPGWVESESVLKGDRWKSVIERIPSQRLGRLEEVAEAVAFLASDKASYINGEILDINGGLIMD